MRTFSDGDGVCMKDAMETIAKKFEMAEAGNGCAVSLIRRSMLELVLVMPEPQLLAMARDLLRPWIEAKRQLLEIIEQERKRQGIDPTQKHGEA